MIPQTIPPATLSVLVPGQRVLARFGHQPPRLGVVSAPPFEWAAGVLSLPVQFEPCGSHFHCADVTPHGDANGWTDLEYRVAREQARSREHAARVEAERRERYPEAPFSAFGQPAPAPAPSQARRREDTDDARYMIAFLRYLAGERVTMPHVGHWRIDPEAAAQARERVHELVARAAAG